MLNTRVLTRTNYLTLQKILVLIMLSILTQAFSTSANAKEKNKLYPRQINLSGNIFHFSMPEDFSKDMPAANMVEALDISDPKKFDNPEYGNLIRRWWDIKEPGWFGKNLGTVMMDISVQRIIENKKQLIHKNPYKLENRMDFIMMLYDNYSQKYEQINQKIGYGPDGLPPYYSNIVSMSGRKISCLYHEHTPNQQKWIRHSVVAPREELILHFSIPITTDVFLQAAFTYSHNNNISPIEFRRGFANQKMELIQQSFKIDYAMTNPLGRIVSEEWLKETNNEVFEQHRDTILKLFYGPNPEAALLEMERKNRESQARDEREIREILKHDPL